MTTEISKEVAEGLKVIKFSGLTDKTNWREAAKIAKAMGFDETATWIRKNPELYKQLVAAGYMRLIGWLHCDYSCRVI